MQSVQAPARTGSEVDAEEKFWVDLERCLRRSCVICIEHARELGPRYTAWRPWRRPCFYQGGIADLRREVDACTRSLPDHYVRLNITDFGCRSRMSVVLGRPAAAA